MCIPTPQAQAAPASTIPSMQAADSLVLPGDAGHGAAQIGRLQLRAFGGFNPPVQAAPAVAPVAPAVAQTSVAGTASAQSLGVPTTAANRTLSPNLSLRLGAAP